MEGRLAADLRRPRQLHSVAERYALRRIERTYAGLFRALGGAASDLRYLRSRGVSFEISDARVPARPVHHADDGNPGCDRVGVDHDVPPATRHSQLSAVAGRHSTAALGGSPRDR